MGVAVGVAVVQAIDHAIEAIVATTHTYIAVGVDVVVDVATIVGICDNSVCPSIRQ